LIDDLNADKEMKVINEIRETYKIDDLAIMHNVDDVVKLYKEWVYGLYP